MTKSNNFDAETYLLSWDMYGLESCINLSAIERQKILDILRDKNDTNHHVSINAIILRAQTNSHRHYEIYTISVDPSITKQDLIDLFDQNPQGMAELVRERGVKIYSNRSNTNQIKIT